MAISKTQLQRFASSVYTLAKLVHHILLVRHAIQPLIANSLPEGAFVKQDIMMIKQIRSVKLAIIVVSPAQMQLRVQLVTLPPKEIIRQASVSAPHRDILMTAPLSIAILATTLA